MLASIPGMKKERKRERERKERKKERIVRNHIMVSLVGHSAMEKNIFSFA